MMLTTGTNTLWPNLSTHYTLHMLASNHSQSPITPIGLPAKSDNTRNDSELEVAEGRGCTNGESKQ